MLEVYGKTSSHECCFPLPIGRGHADGDMLLATGHWQHIIGVGAAEYANNMRWHSSRIPSLQNFVK